MNTNDRCSKTTIVVNTDEKKEVISRVGKVADIMPWIYQMLLPFQMGNNNPLENTMGHCIGRLVANSKKAGTKAFLFSVIELAQ